MQPTISIPKHWDYPRFALDQRTKDGIILGLYYYPNGTELAEQFGHRWRYALIPNKNSDELFHFQESKIQPLTPEELLHQITGEINFYQQQIVILSKSAR
jgi:hypothetical protein